MWIGGGIGQVMAFLLARYLIRDFITALLRGKSRKWDIVRSPSLSPLLRDIMSRGSLMREGGQGSKHVLGACATQVDRAMELEGWKLLLLCRLSPMIPYTMINIVMASTRIHLWPFAIVSFFGVPCSPRDAHPRTAPFRRPLM